MAAAAVLLAIGGCGEGSEEKRVRAAALSYLDALVADDHEKACGLMSAAMKETLAERAERAGKATDCPTALAQVPLHPRPELEKLRERTADSTVTIVDGRFATVARAEDGPVEPGWLFLVREGDAWRINPGVHD